MSPSTVNSGHGDISPTTHVEISVYNVRGQLVKTLVDDFKEAGTHTVEWNGDDPVFIFIE
jgi:flagellar hook assembly protein FlgD